MIDIFEIFGLFSEKEALYSDRLCSNLTCFYVNENINIKSEKRYEGKVIDLCENFFNFKENVNYLKQYNKNVILILPPFSDVAKFYLQFCEKIIVKFTGKRKFYTELHPYVTINELKNVLDEFEEIKEFCLIMLTGKCFDYDMLTHEKKELTNNQATLKALVNASVICFDNFSENSYFTYKNESGNPKFVWVEDTKSISVKHNLIKDKGFLGICWDSPYILSEGNWESLYMAYKKANKKED